MLVGSPKGCSKHCGGTSALRYACLLSAQSSRSTQPLPQQAKQGSSSRSNQRLVVRGVSGVYEQGLTGKGGGHVQVWSEGTQVGAGKLREVSGGCVSGRWKRS